MLMKTKVCQTRLLPEGNFTAITLFGLVFTRDKRRISKRVLRHELIHCKQQLELLYIPFFLLYLLEFLVRWIQTGDRYEAYRNISFEKEAYSNENDCGYLEKRKPMSWLRHL